MTRLRMAIWRALAVFKRRTLEDNLDDEIRSHLDMLTADNIRSGMTAEEARTAASRTFGNVDQAKERHRDARTFVAMEQSWKDLRYAVRSLLKSPGFTLFVVMTLALGVGANTTVFNAYNAIALKPIPVSDAEHVVRLKRWFANNAIGDLQFYFSYPEYIHSRDQNGGSFADLVAVSSMVAPTAVLPPNAVLNVAWSDHLRGQLVSANFFSGLGVVPQLGRGFAADEDRLPGGNPVIVLSHGFWERILKSDSQVLGQTLNLNGAAFTIVGVAPPEFTGTGLVEDAPDFWAPLSMQPKLAPGKEWLTDPNTKMLHVLGRLGPSTTLAKAQSQADLLIRQYDSSVQENDPAGRTTAVTLQRARYSDTDDPRFKVATAGLMFLVGLILVVACANIANMLVARCAARQREIGVRVALGAGRSRIIRQLLAESLLLSVLGGLAGLVFTVWASRLLEVGFQQILASRGGNSGLQINLHIDARVFVFALALAVLTGVFFGLSPALRFSRSDLTAAFKSEGFALGQRTSRSRLRGALIGLQVAVSMFFLITAGLLVRGVLKSQGEAPGFGGSDVFILRGNFGDLRSDAANATDRQRRFLDTIRTLPDLRDVAVGSIPFGGTWAPPIVITRATDSPSRSRTIASYGSKNYLDFLGIGLLRGRNFTREEAAQGAHVAVVSESGARLFWPDEDPLGKHFQLDMDWRGHLSDFEVVGIAKDVRFANLTRIDPSHFYLPADVGAITGGLDTFVKIRGGLQALPAIQSATAAIDKDLSRSLFLMNFEDGVSRGRLLLQLPVILASLLAFFALLLAGAGIYGVMAYLVTQRTREIGIRMSVGATSSDVLKGIVLQGLRPVFIGMILGLIAAAGLSSLLHYSLVLPGSMDFLYGVPFYDPLTFVGLSCFVLALAALASLVPARRALRVDPMIALRCD